MNESKRETYLVLRVLQGNRERIGLRAKNPKERGPFIAEDLATLTKVLSNYICDNGEEPEVEITLTETYTITKDK